MKAHLIQTGLVLIGSLNVLQISLPQDFPSASHIFWDCLRILSNTLGIGLLSPMQAPHKVWCAMLCFCVTDKFTLTGFLRQQFS